MSGKRWSKEEIPNDADLYRRVTPEQYNPKTKKISAPAFRLRENENGLSVNWARYTTIQQSACDRGRNYYLAGIYANIPRDLGLKVEHDPKKNRAHSLIFGDQLKGGNRLEYEENLADKARPLVTEI
jgi:hypothetical protein